MAGFPSVFSPVVDKAGQVIDPWHRLFIGFFERREERGGMTVLRVGTHAQGSATAAPTSGTWRQGDVVWKSDAAAGQPNGWRCTVSGSPGTWVAMANL